MDKKIIVFLGIMTLQGLGCDEIVPEYRLERPVPGERKILVEEFTGVRCPNCPEGTLELENLKSIYGESLIIVSIHAGDFVFPYENSKFNFETQDGNRLLDVLGNPIGYPSAVINRKLFEGENSYQLFSSKWISLIGDESSISPGVALDAQIEFEVQNRRLSLELEIIPLQRFDHTLFLVVMIVEDNITDPQADRLHPEGIVEEYVHNNVFRKMLTDANGMNLGSSFDQFAGLIRQFEFVLPPGDGWWKPADIRVVAFVSKPIAGKDVSEVIQAGEWKLL